MNLPADGCPQPDPVAKQSKRTRIRAPIRLQAHRKVSDTTPLPPAAGGRGRGLGGNGAGHRATSMPHMAATAGGGRTLFGAGLAHDTVVVGRLGDVAEAGGDHAAVNAAYAKCPTPT